MASTTHHKIAGFGAEFKEKLVAVLADHQQHLDKQLAASGQKKSAVVDLYNDLLSKAKTKRALDLERNESKRQELAKLIRQALSKHGRPEDDVAVTQEQINATFSEIDTVRVMRTVGDVVMVKETATIGEALKELSTYGILSAPVIDKGGVMVGVIDVVSIVRAVLEIIKEASFDTETARTQSKLAHLFTKAHANDRRVCSKLYVTVPERPLKSVLKAMSLGVHRVVVSPTDIAADVIGLVSQSDVISLFAGHPELVGNRSSKSVCDLGCFRKVDDIIKVSSKTEVWEAFLTCTENNVSAVAVVDDIENLKAVNVKGEMMLSKQSDRVFVGAFSTSSIHSINPRTLGMLTKTVGEYLTDISADKADWAVRVPATALLSDLIKAIHESRAHRVWVVDEKEHLVGLIDLTSLLGFLISPSGTQVVRV